MATQKIPLNKFKSLFIDNISNVTSSYYEAQFERATILLNCQATNTSNQTHTISMYVSSYEEGLNPPDGKLYPIVKDLPIPPKDARSLVTGRLVLRGVDNSLTQPDRLLFDASSSDVVVSIGILEATNKD